MELLIIYVVVLGGVFLLFGFLNKRQSAKKQQLVSQIKTGCVIETIGGIRGEVVEVNEETIVIKSSDSKLEFNSRAVGTIISSTDEEEVVSEEVEVETEVEENTEAEE